MNTLKKLKFKPALQDEVEHFPADITLMVDSLKAFGYEVSRTDVRLAWEYYSGELCAGWLGLPKDGLMLVETLLDYLEEVK